jgi:protein LSM14
MDKEGNKEVLKTTGGQKAVRATGGESAQQKKDYIGCLMSLISKQEIRYVGTLIAINSRDQTLVLQNVRSYGSESRRGGGSDEVPASNQVYEKVSFKAAELKDFYIIKGPESEFKDPAIISTKKVEDKKEENKTPAQDPQVETTIKRRHEYYEERESSAPRRSRYRQRTRGRMEGKFQEHIVKEVKDKYADEFDFEKMNKKFEELFKNQEEEVEVGVKYDKSKSFYDEISRGKEEKTTTPYDRHKQREIDAATFDFDPQYNERRGGYHSRYRGRWRGGYRRGRGQRGYDRGYERRGQQSYYRRRAS